MYPILILREEVVCLIILLFLFFTARSYHLGKDSRVFYRLLLFALVHVVFDIITVWTVNHVETTPFWLNYVCHVVFYLAAILFSKEICTYIFKRFYPDAASKFSVFGLIIPLLYVLSLPWMNIRYDICSGTNSSAGSAAVVGFAIAFLYFSTAFVLIFFNYSKLSRSEKNALLPMLFLLIIAEMSQIIVKELLFTGGAVTIVTVGFFFSLENPAQVFAKKAMTDALTGLKSRHSYDQEITEMETEFKSNPSSDYIFAYCDINDLRSVNSSYGHQEGDNYITLIASGISVSMRHARSIYRLGGDEFLAVYYQCRELTVITELEKLQAFCRQAEENLEYIPSVAVGYAVSNKEYKSLKDVVRTADYLMYKHKAEKSSHNTYITGAYGTKLNLSGLTDRVFNAMCASSERYYPFITNLETNVTRVAPEWAEYFGLPNEYMADFEANWSNYLHPDDRQIFIDEITAALSEKEKYYVGKFRAVRPDGEYVLCSCRGAVYYGKSGEPDIFTGYLINHGVQEKVDPTTGLPNFIVTDEYVQDAIDHGKQAIIVKLGINQFSRINMLYGYLGGDSILKEMASIIQESLPENGTLFCQDGMNFSIFLPNCTRECATEIYDRLAADFANGILVNDTMVPIEISGGAVELIPGRATDRPAVRSSLIYALDESVYSGHSKLVFYKNPTNSKENAEFKLLADIHHDAVTEKKYFCMYYQPIVCNDTGEIVGAEALIRWIHPDYGEVSPNRFIGFLEKDPCYYSLGLWIIREAALKCAKFRSRIPNFKVSINITALQLQNEQFTASVCDILRNIGLPTDSIILELTERCKELDVGYLREKIQEIRTAGIQVAFDDMGTGYSTIDLLMNIPVDEIKLDYTFTKDLVNNLSYHVFVEALAKGAAKKKYTICFEGIETEDMFRYVKKYGHGYSQGYYFSKPVNSTDFMKLLV